MSEFIDECRREWRRLGVPDPIANEMAADLSADIEEAVSEGGSAEDVLGSSAFDPRRFAAAWAVSRGVTGQPVVERPSLRRSTVAIVVAALVGVFVVGAGLVLAVGFRSSSVSIATQRMITGPGPIRILPGASSRIIFRGPIFPPFFGGQAASAGSHILAAVLFIVGGVGLGLLVLLAGLYFFYWSPSSRFHRLSRRRS
jgi:hypothetical protein